MENVGGGGEPTVMIRAKTTKKKQKRKRQQHSGGGDENVLLEQRKQLCVSLDERERAVFAHILPQPAPPASSSTSGSSPEPIFGDESVPCREYEQQEKEVYMSPLKGVSSMNIQELMTHDLQNSIIRKNDEITGLRAMLAAITKEARQKGSYERIAREACGVLFRLGDKISVMSEATKDAERCW